MKTNRGLGKGLSALFSETEEDYGKSLLFDEEPVSKAEGVTEIDITSIFANPNQPRKIFDEDALKELADSIEKHGVIMPIQKEYRHEQTEVDRRRRQSFLFKREPFCKQIDGELHGQSGEEKQNDGDEVNEQ